MKNKFIRIISLTVIFAVMLLTSVTAADNWSAPKIPLTPLKNSKAFSDKDAAQLAEALSEASFLCNIFSLEDYQKIDPKFNISDYKDEPAFDGYYKDVEYVELAHVEYTFTKEKDYDVRRVELKHGYYIDMVFVSQKNNGVSSAYIRNKDGYVIAEIILTASFASDGKTVKSISREITGKSYVPQITFTDKYSKSGAEKSNITLTDSAITLKIKDGKGKELGKYRYNAQVTCDIYGDTVSYFSWEKPYEPPANTTDTISFDNPMGSHYFLKDTSKFTGKDAAKLAEALTSIDFSNYELIRGSNYEIKHIQLKYGYYIEIVFESGNDYLTSDDRYNKTRNEYFSRSSMLRIHVCDSDGYILANMQLTANFSPVLLDEIKNDVGFTFPTSAKDSGKQTKSTAIISYQNSYTSNADAVPQITLSSKSRGVENATNESSIVDGIFTMNIKDGAQTKSFTFNAQIECYFNGITTAWVK